MTKGEIEELFMTRLDSLEDAFRHCDVQAIFSDLAQVVHDKMEGEETAGALKLGLTDKEVMVMVDLLEGASTIFSRHGSNDYNLEEMEFSKAERLSLSAKIVEWDPNEEMSDDIWAQDHVLMSFFSHLLEKAVKGPQDEVVKHDGWDTAREAMEEPIGPTGPDSLCGATGGTSVPMVDSDTNNLSEAAEGLNEVLLDAEDYLRGLNPKVKGGVPLDENTFLMFDKADQTLVPQAIGSSGKRWTLYIYSKETGKKYITSARLGHKVAAAGAFPRLCEVLAEERSEQVSGVQNATDIVLKFLKEKEEDAE